MKRTPLALSQALGHEAADKRIDILRRIGEAGSISEAARGAGVSYKAAWQAIETLGNLAGQDLVDKVVGGSGGGGARLTPAGEQLLHAAQMLAQARSQALARLGAQRGKSGAPNWAGLALRTSMRNQLPCTVGGLQRSGGAVSVALTLPDGAGLASRITVESAELLGLRTGLEVLALCKATAVSVARSQRARAGLNRLAGVVSRAPLVAGDREVALRLASGLQLVGFTPPGLALQVGAPAVAAVEDSAIAIAIAG